MMKNKCEILKKELEALILAGKPLTSKDVIKKALELEKTLAENL